MAHRKNRNKDEPLMQSVGLERGEINLGEICSRGHTCSLASIGTYSKKVFCKESQGLALIFFGEESHILGVVILQNRRILHNQRLYVDGVLST